MFNYSFAQANSLDIFSDKLFSLDENTAAYKNTAAYNSSHLFFTSNFSVDLISDKIKAPDVLRLEVDSFEGKDDKINLTILSDHGSRITNEENSSLSTIFAHKSHMQNKFNKVTEKNSIQYLFKKINNE